MILRIILVGLLSLQILSKAHAGIHSAPIVIPANTVKTIQYHPLAMYRIFKTSKSGEAVAIPFQIDERDRYGDFILPRGKNPNTKFSNGIFDYKDEISIMGDDVGPAKYPTKWKIKKPSVLYEVTFNHKKAKGAVYIGAYFNSPPPLSKRSYVNFDLKKAQVRTSRYHYYFNNNNYLVVRGVNIMGKDKLPLPMLESSTFYLKADLKYFLTFEINQKNVTSELDAYKNGPIRTIARVNFNYNILKLNFDLGMYTEVSFFSNSVILPAIIDNPLDGDKSLNSGSLFYYGFAMVDSPGNLKVNTNMPSYGEGSLLDFLKNKKAAKKYWLNALASDYMVYVEMMPSLQMRKAGNIPTIYRENIPAAAMRSRSKKAAPLGKSPVNIGFTFDLTGLAEGVHRIALRLFIDNVNDPKKLEEYKTVNNWKVTAGRLPSKLYK